MKKIVAGPVEYLDQRVMSNMEFVQELTFLLDRLEQNATTGARRSNVIRSSLRVFLEDCATSYDTSGHYSEESLTGVFNRYEIFVKAYAAKLGVRVVENAGLDVSGYSGYMDINPPALSEDELVSFITFVHQWLARPEGVEAPAFEFDAFIRSQQALTDWAERPGVPEGHDDGVDVIHWVKNDLGKFNSGALRDVTDGPSKLYREMVSYQQGNPAFSGMSNALTLVILLNILRLQPENGYSNGVGKGKGRVDFRALKDPIEAFLKSEFSELYPRCLTPTPAEPNDSFLERKPGAGGPAQMAATPLRYGLPGMLRGSNHSLGPSDSPDGEGFDPMITAVRVDSASSTAGASKQLKGYTPSTPSRPMRKGSSTLPESAAAGTDTSDVSDATLGFFNTVLDVLPRKDASLDETTVRIVKSEVLVDNVRDLRLSKVYTDLTPQQQREIFKALQDVQTPSPDAPEPGYYPDAQFSGFNLDDIQSVLQRQRPRSIDTPGPGTGRAVDQQGVLFPIGDTIPEEPGDGGAAAADTDRRSKQGSRRSWFRRRSSQTGHSATAGVSSFLGSAEFSQGSLVAVSIDPGGPASGDLEYDLRWDDDATLNTSMDKVTAVSKVIEGARAHFNTVSVLKDAYPDFFKQEFMDVMAREEKILCGIEDRYTEIAVRLGELEGFNLDKFSSFGQEVVALQEEEENLRRELDSMEHTIITISNAFASIEASVKNKFIGQLDQWERDVEVLQRRLEAYQARFTSVYKDCSAELDDYVSQITDWIGRTATDLERSIASVNSLRPKDGLKLPEDHFSQKKSEFFRVDREIQESLAAISEAEEVLNGQMHSAKDTVV